MKRFFGKIRIIIIYVSFPGKKDQLTFLFSEKYSCPFLFSFFKTGINSRFSRFRNAFLNNTGVGVWD